MISEQSIFQRKSTLVLVVFLVIRSVLMFITIDYPAGGLTLDSKNYIELSEVIRFEGNYQNPNGAEDLRRPPVYPAFLAIFQSKVGLHQSLVSLTQLLLVSASSLIVLWMLARLGYHSAGIAAGWLIAMSPNINLWSLTIMSEVLFTFLLVLSLALISKYIARPSTGTVIVSGVVMGLATLTRPIGLIVVALWMWILVTAVLRKRSSVLKISTAVWFAVGCALVIFPWMVRNAAVHHTFSVSDIGTHTLESFNFAVVLSEAESISRNDATYRLGELGGTWDQFRWLIVEYPLSFIRSQVAGVGRVIWGTEITRWASVAGLQEWAGFGVFRYLRAGDLRSALVNVFETVRKPSELALLLVYMISVFHTLALFILSVFGIIPVKEPDVRRRMLTVLCTASALCLILISGAAGQARFRVPAEPFVAVIAGFGWWELESKRNTR